jgi:single-strand DNA-binding protein
MAAPAEVAPAAPDPVNEVRLVGRLSADPEVRTLPSGDTVVQLRVVVARGGGPSGASRRRRPGLVDTIDVSVWGRAGQRAALRLRAGDGVGVDGALRRRFWRSAGGPSSRYEVEASAVRRVGRAPRMRSRTMAG